LPIILLTSVGWQKNVAQDVEIAGFMTKPVRRVRLRKAIQSLVGRNYDIAATGEPSNSAIKTRQDHNASRVLLAEDNVVNQRLARRLIEKLGCRVELANDGNEAVAAVLRATYDLILMDCQMPVLDGSEATRQIRLHDAVGHRTPIIALTASAMDGDRERCLKAGMDDYLTKPLKFSELSAIIQRWSPLKQSGCRGN
jgi:two-component system sensor histidine kinase/response regulator